MTVGYRRLGESRNCAAPLRRNGFIRMSETVGAAAMAKGRITSPQGGAPENGLQLLGGCGFTQDDHVAAIWTGACVQPICGGGGGHIKEMIAQRL